METEAAVGEIVGVVCDGKAVGDAGMVGVPVTTAGALGMGGTSQAARNRRMNSKAKKGFRMAIAP
jgi:hypothetical protein